MKKLFKLFSLLLAAGLLFTLTACVPSAEKAEEKMNEAGYFAIDSSDFIKVDESKVEKVFCFSKGNNVAAAIANAGLGGDVVIAIYYKEAEDAEKAYEEFKNSSSKEESRVKKSGKCVYFGTENGMKDFD